MKKVKIIFLFAFFAVTQYGYSQSLTLHDPSLRNPLIELKEAATEGKISFDFVQQLSDYQLQNEEQPVRMIISLMNVRLKDGITSIKGAYADKFNWQYDEDQNYLLATQIGTLEKNQVGGIEIEYTLMNAPSCVDNHRIGFNVNLQPAACMNGINKMENDQVSIYTCQPALITSLEKLTPDTYQVFPNPANNKVTIQLEQPTHQVTIQVADVQGRILFDQTFEQTQQEHIDISQFTAGTYSLTIKTKDKIAHDKLVVVK